MTDRQGAVDALIDEFHDRRWNHDGDCTAKQWMREFAEALATLASAPDEGPLREAAHKLSWAVLNHLSGHTLEDFAHQLNDVLARPAAAPALDVERLLGPEPPNSGDASDYEAGVWAEWSRIRNALASAPDEGPRCSECGVPISEHPNTDACAIAQESRPAAAPALDVERLAAARARLSSKEPTE